MTSEDVKTYGFFLAVLLALAKGLQWLLTDKTKVAVIEAHLDGMKDQANGIKEQLRVLTIAVEVGFANGRGKMDGHAGEIADLRERLARVESHAKNAHTTEPRS